MRLVLASPDALKWSLLLKTKYKHILHSFEYKRQLLTVLEKNEVKGKNIYIDSGAFSAWNKGSSVDLGEYIEFCKFVTTKYPDNEWNIVNLDVIPGKRNQVPSAEQIAYSAEQGWANYEAMKSAGLNVMHIFHQHEDFSWLHKLIKSSKYIGISPDNSQSVKSRTAWLRRVFAIVRTKVKTHGFAATGDTFVNSVPFYSADSLSWFAGAMYARSQKFVNGKMKSLDLNDRADAITSKVKRKGRTIDNLSMVHVIEEYKRKEDFVTRLWAKRGITFDD